MRLCVTFRQKFLGYSILEYACNNNKDRLHYVTKLIMVSKLGIIPLLSCIYLREMNCMAYNRLYSP